MTSKPLDVAMDGEALTSELRRVLPMFWVVRASDTETVLRGPLTVADVNGADIETFTVEVAVPHTYPLKVPVVTEVSGRIPRSLDRHINETNASCCIELPLDFHRRRPQLSISEYLLGPVRSYFLAQLHFEQFGTWPAGERGHGFDGVREAMLELFGIDDVDLLSDLITSARHWHKRKRAGCPCGSRRRLSACHGKAVRAEVRTWPDPALDCLQEMLAIEQNRRLRERSQLSAAANGGPDASLFFHHGR